MFPSLIGLFIKSHSAVFYIYKSTLSIKKLPTLKSVFHFVIIGDLLEQIQTVNFVVWVYCVYTYNDNKLYYYKLHD